ncbi:hypothetical protein GCM10010178_70270 [Lentzea flava]|uniref:Secreted protein n=1 Tax=Lentzea flava TaxID=103732 RepID=A0ABQ2V4C7_9PSEU|nr:hypothetical protein GCM10010178_70270 [Lentzea flava]
MTSVISSIDGGGLVCCGAAAAAVAVPAVSASAAKAAPSTFGFPRIRIPSWFEMLRAVVRAGRKAFHGK